MIHSLSFVIMCHEIQLLSFCGVAMLSVDSIGIDCVFDFSWQARLGVYLLSPFIFMFLCALVLAVVKCFNRYGRMWRYFETRRWDSSNAQSHHKSHLNGCDTTRKTLSMPNHTINFFWRMRCIQTDPRSDVDVKLCLNKLEWRRNTLLQTLSLFLLSDWLIKKCDLLSYLGFEFLLSF